MFAVACVDGTSTTAPRVQPTADIVQGSCRVSDDAASKVRTLSGNCSNSTVKLPTGWTVRFDRAGTAASENITSSGIAAFRSIGRPVAQYTSQTNLIDISGIPDLTLLNSISDGTVTVNFNTQMDKRSVPFTWGSWGSPPFTESATPSLLFSSVDFVNMTISQDVQAFGFELEPNLLQVFTFTARFFDSSRNLLGTITRDVDGTGGARLFAAQSTTGTNLIRGVRVGSTGGPQGFGIAQVRYAP
jgi:hypothetical protein